MRSLILPAPELALDPPGGPAAIERPVPIRLGTVRTEGGQELTVEDVRTLGAFIYRGPLGAEEIWDEAAKAWKAPAPVDASGLVTLKPLPLTEVEGAPAPWTGMLVPVGQTDGAGRPQFSTASGGAPVYRLRAFAHAVRNGIEYRGTSAVSPELQFMSAAEKQRFAVLLDTGNASDAGVARLVLKNSALQPAGYLEIRATGGQEVEIANTAPSGGVLARVTLAANGDVRLAPAPGRAIVLEGRLEAEQIEFQPLSGGPRLTL